MLGVIIVQLLQFLFSVVGMYVLLIVQICDNICIGNLKNYITFFYVAMLYIGYFMASTKLMVVFTISIIYHTALFMYSSYYYAVRQHRVGQIYSTYAVVLMVIIIIMMASSYLPANYSIVLWYTGIVTFIYWFLTLTVYCNLVDQRATTVGISQFFLANY